MAGSAALEAEQLAAVKTVVRVRLEVFLQLPALISGTSLGSANVISAHCRLLRQPPVPPTEHIRHGTGEYEGSTYAVQRGAVLGDHDDLEGRVVADIHMRIGRQRDLGQADALVRVRVVAGPEEADGPEDGVGHVGRVVAEAHVDVEEALGVALEPAGLEADAATGEGPLGAVLARADAAAWLEVMLVGWSSGWGES